MEGGGSNNNASNSKVMSFSIANRLFLLQPLPSYANLALFTDLPSLLGNRDDAHCIGLSVSRFVNKFGNGTDTTRSLHCMF
jgi:hypothetical protein